MGLHFFNEFVSVPVPQGTDAILIESHNVPMPRPWLYR